MRKLLAFARDFLLGFLSRPASAATGAKCLSLTRTLPSGYSAEREEERTRAKLVNYMRSQIGDRYKLGAEILPGHEMEADEGDCSEYIEAAYRIAGKSMPDWSPNQYAHTQAVHEPKPGDLGFVFSLKWKRVGHVVMATAEGTIIHAEGGRGVVEDSMAPRVAKWQAQGRWMGWRRHIDFARPPEDRA